ncbi:MAG: type II toxin-antitoxin system HicB family antitoxin [Neomegalonema sp.]|nr:type II toxin-antitoxin system HicB family antitoxin [Neomegalonema sp.]
MRPYKGYTGSVEFDEDDLLFHGRLMGISDVVTFQAESATALVQAFHDSVDDYLAFCAEEGDEPQKPYSGKLALRTPPALHKAIAERAQASDRSINQWIVDTLSEAIAASNPAQTPVASGKRPGS